MIDPRRTEAEKIAKEVITSHGLEYNIDTRLWEQPPLEYRIAQAILAAEDRGAQAERSAWKECIKDLGPLLAKAKADGVLDTLIEVNIWPVPATCISDADMAEIIAEARRIRPMIEAEGARGQWQLVATAPSDGENILVFGGCHREPTILKADGSWWRYAREDQLSTTVPTHWQPLPPIPQPEESGDG